MSLSLSNRFRAASCLAWRPSRQKRARLGSKAFFSVRSAQPGILPADRDVLIISTVTDVGAIVVAQFDRLVPGQGNRGGGPNTRIPLTCRFVYCAIHGCASTKPEIGVKRDPQPGLEIVAEVSFEGTRYALRLSVRTRGELIMRKELVVCSKKPDSSVSIKNPMAPTSGIAKLWLESPAIGSIVDEFGRIVLPRRGNQFYTDSDDSLLPP